MSFPDLSEEKEITMEKIKSLISKFKPPTTNLQEREESYFPQIFSNFKGHKQIKPFSKKGWGTNNLESTTPEREKKTEKM